MELDKSLIKEFVQATNDSETKPQNTYLRGTVVKNSGGKYVQLDGSTTATPISEIVDVEEGDRVLVSIENHKATIIGNFSFPPSARKEQEAIDKAEAAQGTANGAGEAANLAQEKAQEASNKADTAVEQSSIASASADEAKQQATDAINQANTASTNASEAKSLAAGASSDASEAKTLASQSQVASANAQAEVTRLQGEVNAAKEDAADAIEELNKQAGEIEAIKENYSTKVDLGNTKTELETEISKKVGELQTTIGQTYSTKTENVELEGRLQSQITQTAEGLASQVTKIEKIEADTTEAQKDVEEALTKANAANTAASEAQSKADAAQAAANTAASNAQSAVDKATIAQNAADAATAAANAADQAVQSAQSDLNEAKQNLANVTSRVDATEADIAEAQSKVDAAQTAVNNALADAAEANLAANKAQEAADKAQQDAETAQGAANTAQQKADNAQTAANNAQAAADKAQADVAALTSRVTSAETKITQNAEQIALTASKTEEIGTKFDNLEIGGRNLALRTKTIGWFEDDTVYRFFQRYSARGTLVERPDGFTELRTTAAGYYGLTTNPIPYNFKHGDNISVSCDVDAVNARSGINMYLMQYDSDNKRVYNNVLINGVTQGTSVKLGTAEPNTTQRFSCTFVWDEALNTLIANGGRVMITLQFSETATFEDSGYLAMYKPKIEYGNKPTDWTPAPEDVDEDVNKVNSRLYNNYYSKTETDAKLQIESDRITSTVSKIETVEKNLNSLEIGGRNIIQNSGNFEVKEPWYSNATGGSLEVIEYENKKCLHAINSIVQTNVSYQLEFDTDYVYHTYVKFVEGCTMSSQNPLHYWIWAYDSVTNSRPSDYTAAVKVFSEVYVDIPGNKTVLPNTWHHLVLKFATKTQEETGKQYVMFKPFLYGHSATGEYWLQWIKLEKGNKPTDWSPAPEDARNDLNNSLTNYYSKTETDAKLQVESDRITSAVSKISTVETNFSNLTIGGRNLLLNSSFRENSDQWTAGTSIKEFTEKYGKKCPHIQHTAFGTIKSVKQNMLGKLEPNTSYTMSGWVLTENIVKGPTNHTIMFYLDGTYIKDDGSSSWFGPMSFSFPINSGEGSWVYLTRTFTTDDRISTATRLEMQVYTRDFTGDVYFYNLKLEKGNKATDWTPAPEDTENEIDSAVSKIETVETNFNKLEIGGRNLILNSDSWSSCIGGAANGISVGIENNALKVVSESGNGNYFAFVRQNVIEENLKEGDEFTFSIEIKSDDGTKPPRIYFKPGLGYYDMIGTVSTEYSTVYYTGSWKDTNDIAFHFGWSQAIGTYYIRKIKMEKGNKPTDWTPAPEDAKNDITNINNNLTNNYYTKTQTDAKFEIESDRITSTVTKVEETQQELDNLTISGRNMLLNSELAYPYTDTDYSSSSTYSDKTASSRAVNSKGNAYCSVLNNFAIPMNELLTKVDDEFVFSLDASITGNFKNLRFDLDTRIPRAQSYYFNPVIKIPDDCSKNEWIRVSGIGKLEPARQLFNFKDTTNVSTGVNQGITVDSDGWITAIYNNSEGTSTRYLSYYTHELDLKLSTTYAVVTEIKEVSGTGMLSSYSKTWDTPQKQGQFSTQKDRLFTDIKNAMANTNGNLIRVDTPTTLDTFENIVSSNTGIRTLVAFRPGESGSITFRISVLEDTTITPETFVYQPYVGSTLRQLFNYEDTTTVTEGITVEDGWISVTCDNTNGTNTKTFKYYTNNLDLQTATEYAIFYEIKEISGNGYLDRTEYDGQMAYANASRFDSISVGVNRTIMETDADFSSATIPGLGTGVRFSPGQSGSITFRISVYDDVNMTPENFIYAPYGESPDSSFLRVSWDSASMGAKVAYRYPKLEEGNRVTAWTPAPEDTSEIISKVEDNVTARLDEVNTSIEKAQSTIDQLSNMISHLVTDNNGGSLMTQTPDGWTFNMSNVTDNLTAIKDAMVNMENDQNGTNDALNKLSDLVNDVANKTAYITMSMDDNGDPCIELGKADNPFKVRITNTAIDFLEGSTKIAYANNNTFYSEKIIVKNELQIGEGPGFVWRTRANGNMGLIYISG